MPKLHQAFLNISSYYGDRLVNILEAVQLIQTRTFIRKISSFYEDDETDTKNRRLNRVCLLKTELLPQELNHHLQWIEKRIRTRNSIRNGIGIITLEILLFDDLIMDTPELVLPHPLLHSSISILQPLLEIAPKLAIHPESGWAYRWSHRQEW